MSDGRLRAKRGLESGKHQRVADNVPTEARLGNYKRIDLKIGRLLFSRNCLNATWKITGVFLWKLCKHLDRIMNAVGHSALFSSGISMKYEDSVRVPQACFMCLSSFPSSSQFNLIPSDQRWHQSGILHCNTFDDFFATVALICFDSLAAKLVRHLSEIVFFRASF